MFLSHYTGSGIPAILELDCEDYFTYLEEAISQYKDERKAPVRVVIAGMEK